MADESDSSELLNDLIARALKAGADAADAVDIKSIALSHAQQHVPYIILHVCEADQAG